MYVYTYMHICVYVYIYIYTYNIIHNCISPEACTMLRRNSIIACAVKNIYIYIYVLMYVYIYIYIYIYVCVNMYVYTHIYIYIYIYIYTHNSIVACAVKNHSQEQAISIMACVIFIECLDRKDYSILCHVHCIISYYSILCYIEFCYIVSQFILCYI